MTILYWRTLCHFHILFLLSLTLTLPSLQLPQGGTAVPTSSHDHSFGWLTYTGDYSPEIYLPQRYATYSAETSSWNFSLLGLVVLRAAPQAAFERLVTAVEWKFGLRLGGMEKLKNASWEKLSRVLACQGKMPRQQS